MLPFPIVAVANPLLPRVRVITSSSTTHVPSVGLAHGAFPSVTVHVEVHGEVKAATVLQNELAAGDLHDHRGCRSAAAPPRRRGRGRA